MLLLSFILEEDCNWKAWYRMSLCFIAEWSGSCCFGPLPAHIFFNISLACIVIIEQKATLIGKEYKDGLKQWLCKSTHIHTLHINYVLLVYLSHSVQCKVANANLWCDCCGYLHSTSSKPCFCKCADNACSKNVIADQVQSCCLLICKYFNMQKTNPCNKQHYK